MQIIAFVARELGGLLLKWAKDKAITYAVQTMGGWVHDGFDWLVERVTGQPRSHWDKERGGLHEAALGLPSLQGSDLDSTISALLRSREGAAFLRRWNADLEVASGYADDRAKTTVLTSPIPRSESLHHWAERIGAQLGLAPDEVLRKREAS
jgi:hypothetical protein